MKENAPSAARSARETRFGASIAAVNQEPVRADPVSTDALRTDPVEAVSAHVWEDGSWSETPVEVPREEPMTITLNGREFITMLATPGDAPALAVGFLFSEGIIDRADQVESLEETPQGVSVQARGVDLGARLFEQRVLTSGCGRAFTFGNVLDAFAAGSRRPPEPQPWVRASVLRQAVGEVYRGGDLYRRTRGTHAAALVDTTGSLVAMTEDIGRHNAVDKAIGRRLLTGASFEGLFMVVTGRISSEMVSKIAKTPIPLVVSKSAPTGLALEHAERVSLCVVGRARGRTLTVFTFPEWVDLEG